MNLRDIYEKDEEEDAVDIRDPATRWLIKKARAKYAYAETDLEAFVKFMQDEVQAEKDNIQHNTDDIEHESEVNVLQQKEIDHTEASAQKSKEVNIAQEKHLKRLDTKEKQIDDKLAQFDAVKLDIEMKLKKRDEATLDDNTVQIGR
jgi:hypothetical protein